MHPLYELLTRLDSAHLHYTLSRYRDDTILVTVTFVGERTEIDVFEDGHMEISRFAGSEASVGDQSTIYEMIERDMEENA